VAKLEGALEIVFGAFGESGPDFANLLLGGWARAAADGQYRLVMAWLREQFRLSIEEILDEGMRTGAFRADLDAGAVASVILGAAEGCLLQSGSQGGTVPTERLVRAVMRLAGVGDPGGASPDHRDPPSTDPLEPVQTDMDNPASDHEESPAPPE
jgi:BetI-type transcriptional repressor, C-terminal